MRGHGPHTVMPNVIKYTSGMTPRQQQQQRVSSRLVLDLARRLEPHQIVFFFLLKFQIHLQEAVFEGLNCIRIGLASK